MARKIGLTPDDVVSAAARIADEKGLAALSLAAVASALGVRTPSLYAHVNGLEGLRRDLAHQASRRLGEQLRLAADDHEDPLEGLRALSHAYRRFARKHPGQYAALLPAPDPQDDPEGAAIAAGAAEVVASVLTGLGISAEHHVDLIRTMRALLHGFVDLENGHGFGLADPVDASFESAVDLLLEAVRAHATAVR